FWLRHGCWQVRRAGIHAHHDCTYHGCRGGHAERHHRLPWRRRLDFAYTREWAQALAERKPSLAAARPVPPDKTHNPPGAFQLRPSGWVGDLDDASAIEAFGPLEHVVRARCIGGPDQQCDLARLKRMRELIERVTSEAHVDAMLLRLQKAAQRFRRFHGVA